MNASQRIARSQKKRAFTLIEILVVVAIIALLISILMPALKSAKETSKATVCLSGLKQQGNGFAAYSKDNKQFLPNGGKFRYFLMDGGYNIYPLLDGQPPGSGTPNVQGEWFTQGMGALYPRYTGNTLGLFYCPSNTDQTADSPSHADDPSIRTQSKLFLYNYNHRKGGGALKSHNTNNCPVGGYAYGLPLALGKSPHDGSKYVYDPEDSMKESFRNPDKPEQAWPQNHSSYYQYMVDKTLTTSSVGPVAPAYDPVTKAGSRGRYPTQALMTDAYFGGYKHGGYHVNGWNVLFSDFHAKRVSDPVKKIANAGGSPYTYQGPSGADVYVAWDFLSSHP